MQSEIDIERLLAGDMLTLSKAITLVESNIPAHRQAGMQLIDSIYDKRKPSIRLGITGIPGVGKSTFIEQLGMNIIGEGKKLAVLAIDPSSNKTGGSILGDKTRMEALGKAKGAFIRPSPSSGTLGGVALRTREAMLLCEAAGFDVIIVETVGVGQSETEVIHITDCFLMLAMPGTGDELQGIKRGIMEAADIIVINKADGNLVDAAMRAKKQLEMALHLYPAREYDRTTKVLTASGLLGDGVSSTWGEVKAMMEQMWHSGEFENRRAAQQKRAFERLTELSIVELVMKKLDKTSAIERMQKEVQSGQRNEFNASLAVLAQLSQYFSA